MAACGKLIEKKDIKAALDVCWIKMDADTIRDIEDGLKHAPDLPKDFSEQILDSKIIEVLTYQNDFAGAIVNSKALGKGPYGVQYLGRIDGIWKCLDAFYAEGEFPTVQAAAENFEKKLATNWRIFVKIRSKIQNGQTVMIGDKLAQELDDEERTEGKIKTEKVIKKTIEKTLEKTTETITEEKSGETHSSTPSPSAEASIIVQQRGVKQRLSSSLPETLGDDIAKIPGVKQVNAGLIDFTSFDDLSISGVLIQGWVPDSPAMKALNIPKDSGTYLTDLDKKRVLLGSDLAKSLGKKVGDKIPLFDDGQYTVKGIVKSDVPYESHSMWVALADLQKFMNRPGQVTGFSVVVDKPDDKTEVVRIQRAIDALGPNIETKSTKERRLGDRQVIKPASKQINKQVKDFPDKTDLSTPETAMAAWSRSCARKDLQAALDLSWVKLDEQSAKEAASELETVSENVPPGKKSITQGILDTSILKVLVYKDDFAAVIIKSDLLPEGRPIGVQHFGRIHGNGGISIG